MFVQIYKGNNNMKFYAKYLKVIRSAKGYDQETLANMSDLSVRTIQRIEAGHSTSLDSLKSISASLELENFNELIQGNDYIEYNSQKNKVDFTNYLIQKYIFDNLKISAFVTLTVITFWFFNLVDHRHNMKDMNNDERIIYLTEQKSNKFSISGINVSNEMVVKEINLIMTDNVLSSKNLIALKEKTLLLFGSIFSIATIFFFLISNELTNFKYFYISPFSRWLKAKLKYLSINPTLK